MKLSYSVFTILFLFMVCIALIFYSWDVSYKNVDRIFLIISVIHLIISIFFHINISRTSENEYKRLFSHIITICVLFASSYLFYGYLYMIGGSGGHGVALLITFFGGGFLSGIFAIFSFLKRNSINDDKLNINSIIDNKVFLLIGFIILSYFLGILAIIILGVILVIIFLTKKFPLNKINLKDIENNKIDNLYLIIGATISVLSIGYLSAIF